MNANMQEVQVQHLGKRSFSTMIRRGLFWVGLIGFLLFVGLVIGRTSNNTAEASGARAVLVDQVIYIVVDRDGDMKPEHFIIVSAETVPVIGRNDNGTITLNVRGEVLPFQVSPQQP